MPLSETLERGRQAFAERSWRDAYNALSDTERTGPLAPDDLERLAIAAYLLGRYAESVEIRVRAHHAFLRQGDTPSAARAAAWVAMDFLNLGEIAQRTGWLARGRRLVDAIPRDSTVHGYVLLPAALHGLMDGDLATAASLFSEAATIGEHAADLDLATLARMGQGRSLLGLGRVTEGLTLLDEVMVAVTTIDVSPIVTGTVYCSVIEACQDLYDVRRAQAWTAALSRWCASQPDLVPFRSECLLHRAEILQLHGAWPDAMEEAQRACNAGPHVPGGSATGAAFYRQAELFRLRGAFVEAEQAYRQATRWGRRPEPGIALMKLGRGKRESAATMISRSLSEALSPVERAALLGPYAEIMLAVGSIPDARAAADELAAIAAERDAPYLRALAAQSMGHVLLHEGDAQAALAELRQAWTDWQELDAPYHAARVRVLIGLACQTLGDDDTAEMEFDAAHWVFRHLGAAPDLAWVESVSRKHSTKPAGGLTARETEVLCLVATGKTNRTIADELFISEKTVARHLSNIFSKLNVSSRVAATAYAYEHKLL